MKITSFDPLVVTGRPDDAIALFEALGFERRHEKTGINDADINAVSMKHPDGFRVTVAGVPGLPQDTLTIRMNVDSFQEAFDFLAARGFKNAQGERVTDTGSSLATTMVAPTGFSISVAEHIKG